MTDPIVAARVWCPGFVQDAVESDVHRSEVNPGDAWVTRARDWCPGFVQDPAQTLLFGVAALLVFLALTPNALAAEELTDPDFDGYSDRWTGAYVGVALFGGPSWSEHDDLESTLGWAVGVSARVNMVMSLLDAQLDYRLASYDASFEQDPIAVLNHAVAASVGVHPLFLTNLGANRFWYMLASTYLQLGFTLNFTEVEMASRGLEDSDVSPGFFVGAGTDFPLTDPDAGGGLWLGVLYRYTQTSVDSQPFSGDNFCEHLFGANLAYRHNGLLF